MISVDMNYFANELFFFYVESSAYYKVMKKNLYFICVYKVVAQYDNSC